MNACMQQVKGKVEEKRFVHSGFIGQEEQYVIKEGQEKKYEDLSSSLLENVEYSVG